MAGANEGLYFKAQAFERNDAVLVSINDASWAGETKAVDDRVFPRRNQSGRMLVLADQNIWDGKSAQFHVLGWKSVQITRTC